MVGKQGGAQGGASVSGGRLDIQRFEWRLPKDTAVGHAVQGHSTCHTEVGLSCLVVDSLDHVQDRLFHNQLQAGGHIGVILVGAA